MSIFSEVIAGAAPRRVPVRKPASGPSESRTAAAITRTPVQRAALGPSLAQRRELYHEMMRERTRQHYAALRAHAVARREAALRSGRRVGPDAGTVGKVPGLGRVSGRVNVAPTRRDLPGATVNWPDVLPTAGPVIGALHTLSGAPGLAGRLGSNAVKDILDVPAQAIPSVYIPAAAAVEAAQGRPQRAQALWQALKEHDPIALAVQGKFREAGRAAEAHPLVTAAELYGGKAALGRAIGAGGRAFGRDFASTERAPLKVVGNTAEERRYSPDVFTKARQVRGERKQAARGLDPNQAQGSQLVRALHERMDRFEHREETVGRENRRQVLKGADKAVPKRARGVIGLGVEQLVGRPEQIVGKLRTERARLDALYAEQKRLPRDHEEAWRPEEVRTNRQTVRAIDRALADPKALAALTSSARRVVEMQRPVEEQLILKQALDPTRAATSRVVPFARVEMGADFDPATRRIVTAEGRPLPAAEIRAEMEARGLGPAGFVSHRELPRGVFNARRRSGGRPVLGGQQRTGAASVQGTRDVSHEAVRRTLALQQGTLDRVNAFDRWVSEFGQGHFPDFEHASEVAKRAIHDDVMNRIPGKLKLVPVRLQPLKSLGGSVIKSQEVADLGEGALQRVPERLLAEALRPGEGPVTLVPEIVVRRRLGHLQATARTTGGKAWQSLTQTFKNVVLPFSTKWAFGNAADQAIRRTINGLFPGLQNTRNYKAVLAKMGETNPEAAQRLRAQAVGGTLYGSAGREIIHRDLSDFEGSRLRPLYAAVDALRMGRGTGSVYRVYAAVRDGIMGLNEVMERRGNMAGLGKEMRQEWNRNKPLWDRALRLGDDAIKDLAEKGAGTNKQVQWAKAVEDVFGNWGKNSPDFRQWLLNYAPFLMWGRAALRFVFLTLPRDHPITTGLLNASYGMTADERRKLGLDKFSPNRALNYLAGSIPVAGGKIRFSGYSSFGVTADLPEFLANMVLPQVGGLQAAFRGVDYKGDKLVDANGKELDERQRALYGAYTQLESMLPLIAIGRRLQEGGGSSVTGSTILSPKTKSGTSAGFGSAVSKVFNPLHVTPSGARGKSVLPDSVQQDLERIHGTGAQPALPASAQQDLERVYGSGR